MKHFSVYFFIALGFFILCSCRHDIDTKLSETILSCDNVPNTLIEGAASKEQISAAQERMMKV
jgi:hypothetical protein